MSCGIYIIINNITNTCYIGQAYDIGKRIKRHIQHLNNNYHHCAYLQNAWNKYGSQAFVFFQLEEIKEYSQLTSAEQFWMDYFKYIGAILYNVLPAKRTHLGIKRSQETKDKISFANKGKKRTIAVKSAISSRQLGKSRGPMSEETKEKISAANKNRQHSEGWKQLQREHLLQVKEKRIEKVKEKLSKQWTICCPDGNILTITNLTQFCRDNNLSATCMNEMLRKKHGRTQHKGYTLVEV